MTRAILLCWPQPPWSCSLNIVVEGVHDLTLARICIRNCCRGYGRRDRLCAGFPGSPTSLA
jgi:hypothetical protein